MSQLPEFQFDNTYVNLPEKLFSRQLPSPVSKPSLIKLNTALAEQLQLDATALQSENGISVLAGNAVPSGADPIAMIYAGHQFGSFAPQLGDGRAILLGELIDSNGVRHDIQLKGAGRTPYSRHGDGRAPLGPVVREYLVSEAMAALGVPTTRALSAVTTGDTVHRESLEPGAVLARVAKSHVRVGTFQFFTARGDIESVKALTDYVIDRHYPELKSADSPPLELLKTVLNQQAALVAHWQSIGFIHGVMNTDNTSVAGITIDYGPCAFMDEYNPATVFSSIDYAGRYAYQNQPGIAQWNTANLAQCLLPLIGSDEDKSLDAAQAVIDSFPECFAKQYLANFGRKIGLLSDGAKDGELIESLLQTMQKGKADFTNTFRALSECSLDTQEGKNDHVLLAEFTEQSEAMNRWLEQWRERHQNETAKPEDRSAAMRNSNPAYIPRNHRVEQVIQAAHAQDFEPMHELASVLSKPYETQPGKDLFTAPPTQKEIIPATFCGT